MKQKNTKEENVEEKRPRQVRWDAAILALLQNSTREKAAEAAGIDPATLYRWLQNPKFQEALLAARREVFGQAMGRLQQASLTAVDTLIGIMDDTGVAPAGRVQASRCVLDLSRKSLELDDIRMHMVKIQKWQRKQDERNH
jgi:hypothetical protein